MALCRRNFKRVLREISSEDRLTWGLGAVSFFAAAVICFGLLLCFKPLLARYALVRPNARSSHTVPTPQGGGIAVIAATTIVVAAAEIFLPHHIDEPLRLAVILASVAGLALVGVTDDVSPMEALPRLMLQIVAVVAVIATLPHDMRIIPVFPWWLDRAIALIGGVWLVNVVNFMDGIDLMTVAEIVPVTAGLALFGLMGALPHEATLVALALCGAVIGFAPFNRPVAQIFLGDVGSLPIGLLLGWCLLQLAYRRQFEATLLLPLYYLCDATATLLRRMIRREPFWAAHRSHYYQRATDNGFSVAHVVGEVFALNVGLAILAIASANLDSVVARVLIFLAGAISVVFVLFRFSRPRSSGISCRG